jgi:hypothetical protein
MPKTPSQRHNLITPHNTFTTYPTDAEIENCFPARPADDTGGGAEEFGL